MQITITANSLDELIELRDFLNNTSIRRKADTLTSPEHVQMNTQVSQPVTNQVPVPPQVQPVTTNTPSYSMDDLARAAMTLMDAGRQQELIQLLTQFGTDSLPNLPKESYGAFALKLREMGGAI